MNNAYIWRATQERLRQKTTSAQFETWLRGTQLLSLANGHAVLGAPTTFAREQLDTRFRALIESALSEVAGARCTLAIEVLGSPSAEAAESDEPEDTPGRAGLFDDMRQPPDGPGSSGAGHTERIERPEKRGQRSAITTPLHRRRSFAPTQASIQPSQLTPPIHPMQSVPSVQPVNYQALAIPQSAQSEPLTYRGRTGADGNGKSANGASNSADSIGTGGVSALWGASVLADEADDDDRAPVAQPTGGYGYQPGYGGAPASPYSAYGIAPPRLNARYTFSTFIVGNSNRIAHAASQAVAEAPGYAYNPLFLYGGVGLGKTHLLHAIGHTALEHNLVVLYVSSETFTNEIVNAILRRTTEEFRAKYRSVDVLLVDDIQFIAGKDSTEEEFFHTFNSLHEANKQIVICSDRPPKAIVSLEDRLRSRFEWGLIADIQPPDLETRIAILRAKMELSNRHVPDDVILYLASHVQSNIRELEGSLNRLIAYSTLQGMPLSVETAKSALASLASDGRQRRVSVGDILDAVADHYHIPQEDLRGKQRDKHIVTPRQVAMYLMRQETDASLLEIGQALGGRDHSTVLHGCEKISREINENTTLRKEVLAIRQRLLE